MGKALLVNFLYYNAVGHVAEALKYTKGFYDANPGIKVSLALNSDSPIELAKACPWIDNTYGVNASEILKFGGQAESLKHIPTQWDYIVTDRRPLMIRNDILLSNDLSNLGKEETSFLHYYKYCHDHLNANVSRSFLCGSELHPTLKYTLDSRVEIPIPYQALCYADRYLWSGRKFCILLAGAAGGRYYPAKETWVQIIANLTTNFPGCQIYITGNNKKQSEPGNRTFTQAYSSQEIDDISRQFPNVVNCYDIGIWNQLALIKGCDAFISPHTGFGMIALCVGTPWLTLSGGDWPETFFNNVPFYSVLPDDPDYPYSGEGQNSKHQGHFDDPTGGIPPYDPIKYETKIPEIMEAAHMLLDKNFTYKKALEIHFSNIEKANIKRDSMPKKPAY